MVESCLNLDSAWSGPKVITSRSELLETENNWRPSVAIKTCMGEFVGPSAHGVADSELPILQARHSWKNLGGGKVVLSICLLDSNRALTGLMLTGLPGE